MKSIEELNRIRDEALKRVQLRQDSSEFRILVGMATCGIAAGARPVMKALVEAKERFNLPVNIQQTGCIGTCYYEPLVEVIDQEGKSTTYVQVTPEIASLIMVEHILNGKILTEYTIAAQDGK